jgi:hypothetical protein
MQSEGGGGVGVMLGKENNLKGFILKIRSTPFNGACKKTTMYHFVLNKI